MEDLNKTQTILLALLVSFVGSIATSIITYSLLVEAPPTITQTVNRVVERTIETVVPATPSKTDVVTREVTVVVQEEDLVVDAISKNETSLVRIWQKPTGSEEKVFYGIGIILNKQGLISSLKTDLPKGLSFKATLQNGSEIDINFASSSNSFSFFKIQTGQASAELKEALLGDSDILQLGQSVIAIKGQDRNTVTIGRITGFVKTEAQDSGAVAFSLVETDWSFSEEVKGAPIVNLKGEVVGFNVSSKSDFIPINILKSDIISIK
jgi:S1-C subfamily serine protease